MPETTLSSRVIWSNTEGCGGSGSPVLLGQGNGREGQELEQGAAIEVARTEKEQERSRDPAGGEGQRGVQLERDLRAGEEVDEDGRVDVGLGQRHRHLVEGQCLHARP